METIKKIIYSIFHTIVDPTVVDTEHKTVDAQETVSYLPE